MDAFVLPKNPTEGLITDVVEGRRLIYTGGRWKTYRPDSANPPIHNHDIADVSGLQGILNNKAEADHSHALPTANSIGAVAAIGGTASGLTLNDGVTEEVFVVTGTNPVLSPTNGSIQTWVLTGNSIPSTETFGDGQSMTLMVEGGATATIDWSSLPVTWKTNGGKAPTLQTTGYTAIVFWKVDGVIYGARVGDA